MDVVALAVSQAYTNEVVTIGGQISNITRLADGTLKITYSPLSGAPIVFDAGRVPPGRSITKAEIDTNNDLILTFDDNTTINAGSVISDLDTQIETVANNALTTAQAAQQAANNAQWIIVP